VPLDKSRSPHSIYTPQKRASFLWGVFICTCGITCADHTPPKLHIAPAVQLAPPAISAHYIQKQGAKHLEEMGRRKNGAAYSTQMQHFHTENTTPSVRSSRIHPLYLSKYTPPFIL
jgi:hypothetical protein